MAKVKYVNSKLKQKTEKREQKRAETINRMDFYQGKYHRASNKIFDICRLRIIESTEEEQNNDPFLRKIILETIEVVYQRPFNLLSKFGTKELKKIRKRLQRNQ